MKRITIFFTLIFVSLSFLNAQQVNYTTVEVYGWGQGLDRGVPLILDIDNDGYLDMLIGNEAGQIWHLEQSVGNEFTLIDYKFSDIDVGSEATPTIADINNNGLLDLIVGSNGSINWYEQEKPNSEVFKYISNHLISENMGAHLTPALADLNNDGLIELIVGESLGKLWYYEQDSLNAGTFSLVSNNWLGWDGGVYVHPSFSDFNNDGLLDLLVGENYGKTFHLIQDSVNATTFTQVSDNFAGIDVGQSAAPFIADVDGDKKMDFFCGEYYKGVVHYEQLEIGSDSYKLISDQISEKRDFGHSIAFTIHDIDNDGLQDMLVATDRGDTSYIEHYEQEKPGSLNFLLVNDKFNNIESSYNQGLAIYDIDNDGKLELLHNTTLYQQAKENSYIFKLVDNNFNSIQVGQNPQLTFTDFDSDSLLELVVGNGDGILHYYKQDSINGLTFTEIDPNYLHVDVGFYSCPEFTDIDGDSLQDLIIGNWGGELRYYEQSSPGLDEFDFITKTLAGITVPAKSIPRFADINNDGKLDMLVAEQSGGITLHLRNDDLDITAPAIPQNLSADANGNNVNLSWLAVTDEDLMLYNIYRSIRNDTTVAEYLYSAEKENLEFTDSTITESGKYFYWLTSLDNTGNESKFSNVDSAEVAYTAIAANEKYVTGFALSQNYPNPFNPNTTITYQIEKADHIEIAIFNIAGQKVATLVDKHQTAGVYTLKFDASALASGIYFYRLNTSNQTAYRKMQLIK